jgi:SAM-dependent methyltransferase
MNRLEKILAKVNVRGKGLEIGPSYSPIAPRRAGYDVKILDHLSKNQLIEKYKNANVNLANIEEVDYIWSGQSYADLIGKRNCFDFIIASHVIEHTTDMVGFLNDCASILKEDGVLSLAIPDKRYCFDYFRPITGLGRIVDAHVWKQTSIHSPGTVAEAILYAVTRGGNIGWGRGDNGDLSFFHSPEAAQRMMEIVIKEGRHFDEHAWCFTPHSFRLMIQDICHLGFSDLREVCFFPTEGIEFFVTLSRHGRGTGLSRIDLLKAINSELSS